MQNRQRNFSVYLSLRDYFKKTPARDMVRGNLVNMPRNALIALQGMKLTDEISLISYYGMSVVS